MADLQPTQTLETTNKPSANWLNVTNALEPEEFKVSGGIYACTAEGTFGGATFEFQYSKFGSDYHSLDATNLKFSDDGTWNIEIGSGFVKPIRTGGDGTTDVSLGLSAINDGVA